MAAIAWGIFFLPSFWRQAPIDHIASQFLRGEGFKRQALLEEVRQVETAEGSAFCNPTELHNVVVLRFAILKDAVAAGNEMLVDTSYAPLYNATRQALACAPSDSFVWSVLFWLDALEHGVGPVNTNYLRLSYELGPNEVWIALWRSSLAIAVLGQLPRDLADEAISEFAKLVDTGRLYSQAATIFASAAPTTQNRIVTQLVTVNHVPRQIFAQTLRERGLDISLPASRRQDDLGGDRTDPQSSAGVGMMINKR